MADTYRPGRYAVRSGAGIVEAELNETGLVVRYWDEPSRVWDWSQIAWAVPTRDGLKVVFTDQTDLRLGIDGVRREEFWRSVRTVVGLAALKGDLTPETVEGWLGVEPGQALVVRGWRWRRFWPGMALALLLLGGAAVGRHESWPILAWLLLACYLVGLASHLGQACDHVSADGQGLVARRGRRRVRCAWSQIRRIGGQMSPTIETEAGEIQLPPAAGTERLVEVVERVLALRAIGRGLPAEPPLAETALSRLTGEADAKERGLSLTESDHA
jgi:hypothetical protein